MMAALTGQQVWEQPERLQVTMVEFPTMEQARAWYNSPEYAKALAIRETAVKRRLFFVRGTDEAETA
jgi:uncharacterized protein (DUF1330 family)